MIRMRIDFFAESLGMGTSMVVLMPQAASGIGMEGADDGSAEAGRGVPVLYLLHGLSDDCTIWERRTAIERYAAERGIAVVMPEVRRSFYCDEALGEGYWTFVAEELPQIVARTFHVSTAREDTFVAGLSMGGFGAFKLALNHPDRYAAAASLSGALDVSQLREDLGTGHLLPRVWDGRDLSGTVDDLRGLVQTIAPADLPALFMDCGTDDELIGMHRDFRAVAEHHGAEITWRERPGGHTWEFWDESIQDVLDWLPLRG